MGSTFLQNERVIWSKSVNQILELAFGSEDLKIRKD
jgi:hypothetical protein